MARDHSEMVRLGWTAYRCNTTGLVSMELFGRKPIKVQAELQDAMHAFAQALTNTGYEDPTDYVGSYMCRTIGGEGKVWSEHAYGVAIDWDYGGDTDGDGDPEIDKNPHIHRKIVHGDPGFGVEWQFTEVDIAAIEGIKNTYGEQMWGWLGWKIGDTMHFATKVRPERTTVDWSTVGNGEDDMAVSIDTFLAYLRKTDIEKMGKDKIITEAEVTYFTTFPMWSNDEPSTLQPEINRTDWVNLYNAWQVRSPIWAV